MLKLKFLWIETKFANYIGLDFKEKSSYYVLT